MGTPFVPFNLGTITVTPGEVEFTGVGTAFEAYEAGDDIIVDGRLCRIASIISNTSGTFALPFPGPGPGDPINLPYDWRPAPDASRAITLYASLGRRLDAEFILAPQGRLTLTDGVAIPVADVAFAPAMHYAPYLGNRVPIFDGDAPLGLAFGDGLTLVLDDSAGHTGYHAANKCHDVFAILIDGAPVLATGPAWADDLDRGSGVGSAAVELLNGIWTNGYEVPMRFGTGFGDYLTVPAGHGTLLGSIYIAATAGLTNDTLLRRNLSNAYNPVPRLARCVGSGVTHGYSTAAFRLMDNNTVNQLYIMQSLPGLPIVADAIARAHNSTSTKRNVLTGIGVNRTNNRDDTRVIPGVAADGTSDIPSIITAQSHYEGFPLAGLNKYAWLEYGAGADTQTWYHAAVQGMTVQAML